MKYILKGIDTLIYWFAIVVGVSVWNISLKELIRWNYTVYFSLGCLGLKYILKGIDTQLTLMLQSTFQVWNISLKELIPVNKYVSPTVHKGLKYILKGIDTLNPCNPLSSTFLVWNISLKELIPYWWVIVLVIVSIVWNISLKELIRSCFAPIWILSF